MEHLYFKSTVEFMTGGAPPPAAVVLHTEALGFVVSHGFGMTEVAGVVVSCAWKSSLNRFPAAERAKLKARQGVRTLGLTAADVVDPKTGQRVKRDGVSLGEIVVRGSSEMLGYLKNPAAMTACMREDGWLYTGDVENGSSVEVESVL